LVAANVEYMNHEFTSELQEPIQLGIGIHGGEVIIGDIGFRDHTIFTALGDPVNVADPTLLASLLDEQAASRGTEAPEEEPV
jgi:hypothetical protein